MKYSVDTSALIGAWNRHYPPDIFPQLWRKFEDLIAEGQLVASEEVLFELERKDDAVLGWAKKQQGFFVPTDAPIQIAVRGILSAHRKLIDERKGRSGADPFVIALAKLNNCAVLTDEKPTNRPDRPHIPDVCDDLGIPWLDLLRLFREQNWVLG